MNQLEVLLGFVTYVNSYYSVTRDNDVLLIHSAY
jgi:hypothetical protein